MSNNSSSLPDDLAEFQRLTNIAEWIYRIWTIPFVVVGICGNLLALLIFRRWINCLSVYVYFTAFCFVNICIVLIDIEYHYLLPYIVDNHFMVEHILPIACNFIFFLTYFFRYLFIWLIVCINIDRCLFLTESRLKKALCHQCSAIIVCCILIILSCMANIHFLIYFNQPIITQVPSSNDCLLSGLLCHCKSSNKSYRQFWDTIWPIYNIVLFAAIPFGIMIICCGIIIRHMRLTRQQVIGIEHRRGLISSRNDHLKSVGKTLICLDLLFPITIFPVLIFQTYVKYNTPKICHDIGIMNILFAIGFASSFIKNTFSFVVFWLTGQKFRRAVLKLVHTRDVSVSSKSH